MAPGRFSGGRRDGRIEAGCRRPRFLRRRSLDRLIDPNDRLQRRAAPGLRAHRQTEIGLRSEGRVLKDLDGVVGEIGEDAIERHGMIDEDLAHQRADFMRFAGVPVFSACFGGGHVGHRPAFQAGRIRPGMAAVSPARAPAKIGLRVARRGEASDRFKGARLGVLGPSV